MDTIERGLSTSRRWSGSSRSTPRVAAGLRSAPIRDGLTFLWAFLDKAFALGFSTGRVLDEAGQTVKIDFFGPDAWINGASPTAGAVGFALKGPFADNIQAITSYQMTQAGPQVAGWIDWVYMVSLVLIGLGLISGVMTRLAAVGGIIWMATFYLGTAIWPSTTRSSTTTSCTGSSWSGDPRERRTLLRPRQGLAAGRIRAGPEVPVLIDPKASKAGPEGPAFFASIDGLDGPEGPCTAERFTGGMT